MQSHPSSISIRTDITSLSQAHLNCKGIWHMQLVIHVVHTGAKRKVPACSSAQLSSLRQKQTVSLPPNKQGPLMLAELCHRHPCKAVQAVEMLIDSRTSCCSQAVCKPGNAQGWPWATCKSCYSFRCTRCRYAPCCAASCAMHALSPHIQLFHHHLSLIKHQG